MCEWIDIHTRLPKMVKELKVSDPDYEGYRQSEIILVCTIRGTRTMAIYEEMPDWFGEGQFAWYQSETRLFIRDVKYWMPLPNAPK